MYSLSYCKSVVMNTADRAGLPTLYLPSVYVLTSKLNTRNVRIFGDLILKEKANK